MSYIIKKTTRYTSIVFTVLGFVGLLFPLDSIILFVKKEPEIKDKITFTAIVFTGVVVVAFVISALVFKKKNRRTIVNTSEGHHIFVEYGDIFDDSIVDSEKRNIVVSFNRTFDTIVDDDLIRRSSHHGQMISKFWPGEQAKQLDKKIKNNLNETFHDNLQTLTKSEKRKGNRKEYPVGTIAEVEYPEHNIQFFLVGLTHFDENLHAHYSGNDYQTCLQSILNHCINRAQHYPVIMPIIGAGANDDTGYDEMDLLQYMVSYFRLNRKKINFDIHMVVDREHRNRISIFDID